ncbi:MAG: hypothetical protein LVQ97_03170 [Candidatus Micrarchaeales archaeon]|uniref:Transcription factor CBF/NF-Y/histone domain protein n=1 Tax=Candidatus Micrarchaeum acidiphilum ARMAN-2 TaxID=425595 RepID=C7DGA1_MICA2|nr:MAG: hypothetical protein UNLARM2_0105 [Candidatus Micrarchaeum acidiphilum ARMAN-2]MCW6161160.1 hypothetical protein [Candidatus Micrarchaeales archaeon]
MSKQRGFSPYDIEQFLKEAGAEKINENAVFEFEKELECMLDELVEQAKIYANYAGRKKLIRGSDIDLARHIKIKTYSISGRRRKFRHAKAKGKARSLAHARADAGSTADHGIA